MMSLEKFIESFEAAVEDVEPGALQATTDFKSLKSWDSLAVLTVTDMVDVEFRVLLRREDYLACASLNDLYEAICRKVAV